MVDSLLVYTIAEGSGARMTTPVLANLCPALAAQCGANWWAAIDVWATANPGLFVTAPRASGDCAMSSAVEVQFAGPVWLPNQEAIAMVPNVLQLIDGIVALAASPAHGELACLAVVEAFDSSCWRVFTSEHTLVNSLLGVDVEVAELASRHTYPVGISLEWVLRVDEGTMVLSRRPAV